MARNLQALVLLSLIMACANCPAWAQGQDPVVGIAHSSSDDVVYAVTAGGSAYRGRFDPATSQTTWTYDGNVFAICSCGGSSPLVGCAVFDNYVYALAEDGSLFISGGNGSWGSRGSMGAGVFTTLGMSSPGPSTAKCLLAVTTTGQVYSLGGCASGNLLDSRPTPVPVTTWGRVKADRR